MVKKKGLILIYGGEEKKIKYKNKNTGKTNTNQKNDGLTIHSFAITARDQLPRGASGSQRLLLGC